MNEPRDVFHFVAGCGVMSDWQSLSVTGEDCSRTVRGTGYVLDVP